MSNKEMLFLDEQRQVYREEPATYETASGEHGVCHREYPPLRSQGPRLARTEHGEEPAGTRAEQAITLKGAQAVKVTHIMVGLVNLLHLVSGKVPISLRAQFSRRQCLRLALIHPMDQDIQIYILRIFQ